MKNNNPYLAGISDCWYSGMFTDLWIEYKYIPISRPNVPVIPDLSRQQLLWTKDRKYEGRNLWVVVGYKKGVVIYTELNDMEQGLAPELFLKRTISRKELANQITQYCGISCRHHQAEEPKWNQEVSD